MRRKSVKIPVTPEMVADLEFFQRIAAGGLEATIRRCEGWKFAPSAEIISHNDASHDVYFLVSGRVQVTVYSVSGRVITFDELWPGDMFGELATIDHEPRMATVVAIEESKTLKVPGEVFMELVTSEPELCRFALRRLTNLVRQLCGRVFEFHALPVPARIRCEFLRLAEAHAHGENRAALSPRPKDQDVANRVGTNRAQVNRERNALARLGLVELDGSRMVVPDIDKLRREIMSAV